MTKINNNYRENIKAFKDLLIHQLNPVLRIGFKH